MSSLWDDLTDFGAGLLDDVGEGMGNLIDTATTTDTSQNAGTTQQPDTPVKDNHGNTVTQPQGNAVPAPKDNTLLYVGGGVAAVVVLFGLVLIAKK